MKCPACREVNVPGTPLCRRCGATLPKPAASADATAPATGAGNPISRRTLVERTGSVELSSTPEGATPPAFAWIDEVRALIATGRKIEAIKLLREQTGVDLKEAKDAVESLERGEPFTVTSSRVVHDAEALAGVTAALQAGDRMGAIRAYREATGAGLAESRAAVDAIRRASGTVQATFNAATLVALVVSIVVAGAVLWVLFRG